MSQAQHLSMALACYHLNQSLRITTLVSLLPFKTQSESQLPAESPNRRYWTSKSRRTSLCPWQSQTRRETLSNSLRLTSCKRWCSTVREVPTMSMDPISQQLEFITVRITMEASRQEISLFKLCIRTKRQPLELRINWSCKGIIWERMETTPQIMTSPVEI